MFFVVVVVVVFVVCWLPSSDFFSWCVITRLIGNFISLFFLVLLPRLVMMATINNQLQDEDRRREIALELMEAYVSLTCCCIFADFISTFSLIVYTEFPS